MNRASTSTYPTRGSGGRAPRPPPPSKAPALLARPVAYSTADLMAAVTTNPMRDRAAERVHLRASATCWAASMVPDRATGRLWRLHVLVDHGVSAMHRSLIEFRLLRESVLEAQPLALAGLGIGSSTAGGARSGIACRPPGCGARSRVCQSSRLMWWLLVDTPFPRLAENQTAGSRSAVDTRAAPGGSHSPARLADPIALTRRDNRA
jgi:hypothetical protein